MIWLICFGGAGVPAIAEHCGGVHCGGAGGRDHNAQWHVGWRAYSSVKGEFVAFSVIFVFIMSFKFAAAFNCLWNWGVFFWESYAAGCSPWCHMLWCLGLCILYFLANNVSAGIGVVHATTTTSYSILAIYLAVLVILLKVYICVEQNIWRTSLIKEFSMF
jgi:hypothetical protein